MRGKWLRKARLVHLRVGLQCTEGWFDGGLKEPFVISMNRKKERKRAYASRMAQYVWVE
jgi:hypothetical protein